VTVRYDERGVPHIRAENETDLYRALGYVHAQDRLFQMEAMRRLARGELAEVLGPKLLDTDKLFRSLRIRERAASYVASLDKQSPRGRPCKPIWTASTSIRTATPARWSSTCWASPSGRSPPRTPSASPVTWPTALPPRFVPSPADLRARPTGRRLPENLRPRLAAQAAGAQPAGSDWKDLNALARLSEQALADNGLPQFEGSNAWAISRQPHQSGKPLLAGDPHIRFSVPSVWYEAQLSAPGFELYGYHQALVPLASWGTTWISAGA
jgi:penicillin amidase